MTFHRHSAAAFLVASPEGDHSSTPSAAALAVAPYLDGEPAAGAAATAAALRHLLRDDLAQEAGDGRGPREVALLKTLKDGSAPPPWSATADAPVFHLHGTFTNPVSTKQDYRALLYDSPNYMSFLRIMLATHTLFYLGFSFSDAYLEQLSDEVLSLLTPARRGVAGAAAAPALPAPIGFAIVEYSKECGETKENVIDYYRRHEGVSYVLYDASPGHAGFDAEL